MSEKTVLYRLPDESSQGSHIHEGHIWETE